MRRSSFNEGWQVRPKPEMVDDLTGGGAAWTAVRLPHDAMITQPRGPGYSPGVGYFAGGVWRYEKTFEVDLADRGKRIMVEFEGVYRSARVYVNGALAASRPYGYSNFYVRLDPLVTYGATNLIRVEATARDDARWYSGAGIYRHTWLITGGPVHIAVDGVRVSTPIVDREATVVVADTVVENDSGLPICARLLTELVDHRGEVVASETSPLTALPGQQVTVHQQILVSAPALWGVEHPNLYTCQSRLTVGDGLVDSESTRFGIRSVEVDALRGLRINGETVKLRGACIHHDNGVIGSVTLDRAEERRVEILKSAGFNAIRSAHNPMSKAMLDSCDRIGMFVMDEAFDSWTSSKIEEDYARWFPEWWERDLTSMVIKDLNHPSVILYSIGNEIPDLGDPSGAAQSRAMAELIRSIDKSRPVTNGVNPLLAVGVAALTSQFVEGGGEQALEAPSGDMDINAMMTLFQEHLPLLLQQEVVDEKLAESCAALDVVGYNYTDSRYEIDHSLHPNRVIVGSETNPPKIDSLWRLVKAMDHVIGDFTWTGWDYLGESGIGRVEYSSSEGGGFNLWGPYPYLTADCGDIDITGFRRPISYFREIVFGLRDDPYIAVQPPEHHGKKPVVNGPWSSEGVSSWDWPGHEGDPVHVTVFADADEVVLILNGTESGRTRPGDEDQFRAQFDIMFQPGEIVAVAYQQGRETGRTTLRSPSERVILAAQPDRRTIPADDTAAAFVDISLVDPTGTVHRSSDRQVTIAIEGPGELLGFGSANPRTEESFVDAVHTTFEGRALAVVRPTGHGRITITAEAAGCPSVSTTVEAQLNPG